MEEYNFDSYDSCVPGKSVVPGGIPTKHQKGGMLCLIYDNQTERLWMPLPFWWGRHFYLMNKFMNTNRSFYSSFANIPFKTTNASPMTLAVVVTSNVVLTVSET